MSFTVVEHTRKRNWKKVLRGSCLAAATATLVAPLGAQGQDNTAASANATFFTGPGFAGQSKTLTLAADQPYQAIPFVGDELNEKIGSLRVDPGLGVILFQRPYFASRDDACGLNLGTRENRKAWWLGLTADFEPPTALSPEQPYEAAEMQDNDYSSVIAYRRDLGPPPGFLLMERRSYYNRGCENSDEQSYFNRLFVPVPNPPQREACIVLSVAANSYGAGPDAPTFSRLSEAVALFPENFSPRYQGADHRFALSVFAGPGCSGPSITLTSSENGRPARHKLKDFDFDRRAKSVLIRYQRGPLDAYLEPASVASTAPAPTAPAASNFTSQGQAGQGQAGQNQAAQPAAPAAPNSQSLQPQPAAPAGGGLQPAPPAAPPSQQQQALQPSPQVPPAAQPAVTAPPRAPGGPQEETFRFPVHQVYRLNFCVDGDAGCGDPAANTWCENQGFSRAARWAREENIGALYPTVFIGSGTICDKFLCDGFEEITCTR